MKSDLAEILKRLEDNVALLRAAIETPMRDAGEPNIPEDLIDVAAAATLAFVQKDTVRLWARKHPLEGGGFGVKYGGRWLISRAPYLKFIRNR
ncbi:MAG: hypothetical protein ACTHM2_05090 [Afipia sp.]